MIFGEHLIFIFIFELFDCCTSEKMRKPLCLHTNINRERAGRDFVVYGPMFNEIHNNR
jgi:hypothetical protein